MNIRIVLVSFVLGVLGLGALPALGDAFQITTLLPEATKVIDSRGGVVEVTNAASPLYGSRVEIPAGALSGPTEISINRVSGNAGYPADVIVTDIEPHSAKLALPAYVTLKYSPQYLYDNGAEGAEHVHVITANTEDSVGGFETLNQDTVLSLVTVQAPQLGTFVPQVFSNATAKGAYGFVSFRFDRATLQGTMPAKGTLMPRPKGFEASTGTMSFNGAGSFSGSGTRDTDGVAKAFSTSGTYSISSTGKVSVPTSHLSGQILSTGNIIALASTSGSPEIDLMLKRAGSYSNASVKGTYVLASFRYDIGADQPTAPAAGTALPRPRGFTSLLQTLTFDGAGHFTFTGTQNEDGTVTTQSGSGTYSVSSTGVVSVPAEDLSGQVLSGTVVVLATTLDDPEIHMLVKKSGSFSKASVNGAYSLSGFRFDLAAAQATAPSKGSRLPLPRGISSLTETVTFNGAGSFTFTGTENVNGAAVSRSGSGTYSVSSTGVAAVPGLSGQVLSGGSLIIMAAKSGSPEFVVLVKH
ncbi:MAG: hypothetical protein ACM3ZT_04075 [Bacillota bacterium]